MGCNMRNGRKGDIRTCLFCGCGGWAAFLYDRTVPKIGAAFPDSPVRLWIAAYAKLAPCGAQKATPQSLERVESRKPCHIFITGSVYNSVALHTVEKTGC